MKGLQIAMKFRPKLSLRTLLFAVLIIAIWMAVAIGARQNALNLSRQISDANLIGPHQYLNDETLARINDEITGSSPGLPSHSHSYSTVATAQSPLDFILLRQRMTIEYTSHPIPPEYQGEICRHRIEYSVGTLTMQEIGRTKKVLWEYYE